ncbi:hypothetical protein JCM10212_005836 [Sporobolomyces blumeae]
MNALTSTFRTTLRTAVPRPTATTSSSSRLFSTSFARPSAADDRAGSAALDSVLAQVRTSSNPSASASSSSSSRTARSRQPTTASSFYPGLNSSPSSRSSSSRLAASSSSNPLKQPETPEELWRYAPPVAYSPPVTTTSSRSFAVTSGNVARAYRNLNRVLNENNVRKELRRQERFESPSNKRVRLNSERHRRRFKVAVGKAVSLAMRMKDL